MWPLQLNTNQTQKPFQLNRFFGGDAVSTSCLHMIPIPVFVCTEFSYSIEFFNPLRFCSGRSTHLSSVILRFRKCWKVVFWMWNASADKWNKNVTLKTIKKNLTNLKLSNSQLSKRKSIFFSRRAAYKGKRAHNYQFFYRCEWMEIATEVLIIQCVKIFAELKCMRKRWLERYANESKRKQERVNDRVERKLLMIFHKLIWAQRAI